MGSRLDSRAEGDVRLRTARGNCRNSHRVVVIPHLPGGFRSPLLVLIGRAGAHGAAHGVCAAPSHRSLRPRCAALSRCARLERDPQVTYWSPSSRGWRCPTARPGRRPAPSWCRSDRPRRRRHVSALRVRLLVDQQPAPRRYGLNGPCSPTTIRAPSPSRSATSREGGSGPVDDVTRHGRRAILVLQPGHARPRGHLVPKSSTFTEDDVGRRRRSRP